MSDAKATSAPAAVYPQNVGPALRLTGTETLGGEAGAADADLADRVACLLRGRRPATVAKLIGMHPEAVRRYMRGTKPSAEFIRRLCDGFGVSADWLLCGRTEGPTGRLSPVSPQHVAAALETAAQMVRTEASPLAAAGISHGWVVLPLAALPGAAAEA